MISDYLSKEDRLACIKSGALAYAGYLDVEHGPVGSVKQASKLVNSAISSAAAAKSVAVLAALTAGVPIGIFTHIMGRRISGKRLREDELREKIELYRNAADEMANSLPGGAS